MERNHLEIDLNALRHNYQVLKDLAGPQTGIMAMVKSDAYGHGLIPVSKTLVDCGADSLGIFKLASAVALRQAGIECPIVAIGGIFPWEAGIAAEHGISTVVYTLDSAQALSQACLEIGRVGEVMVKVDTGMGRLGVYPEDLQSFLEALAPLRGIRVRGVASHLAASELPDHTHTSQQVSSFASTALSMPADNLANSGAILEGLAKGYPLARPGIALYGSAPAPGMKGADQLKPVMSFKTRIIYVKDLPADRPISYGMTYVTSRKSRIATIPVGYADGYFRLLSNKGVALVQGTRAPVVGTVCMNLTMLDVTGLDGVEQGDEVVLLGTQQGKAVSAEELAGLVGTISYEVFCSLGKANPRIFKE